MRGYSHLIKQVTVEGKTFRTGQQVNETLMVTHMGRTARQQVYGTIIGLVEAFCERSRKLSYGILVRDPWDKDWMFGAEVG